MKIVFFLYSFFLVNFCFSQNNVGIHNESPKSPLAINGAVGNIPTIVTTNSTISNPYVLNNTSTIVIFKAFNTLKFPLASSCPGRVYVIVNVSPGQLTIPFTEGVINLAGTPLTQIISQQSNTFVSDGTNWQKISGI